MTTVAQIVQPDLEAWVWAHVNDLPGVTSFAYAAQTNWPPWLVAYSLQIDARGKTKQATRDTAEVVRQRMAALPDDPWPQGVVSYAQPVEGPFWMPDPDGGPRYVARYEIRAHPIPGSPARQMRAARADRPVRRDRRK